MNYPNCVGNMQAITCW